MGTIINQNGFKILIRTNDHLPPHVHVFRAGNEAKLSIGTHPELLAPSNMKPRELAQAIEIVSQHYENLLKEWEHIHG